MIIVLCSCESEELCCAPSVDVLGRCADDMEAGFIPVSGGGAGGGGVLPPSAVVAPPANVVRAPGLRRGKMEEAITDRVRLPF